MRLDIMPSRPRSSSIMTAIIICLSAGTTAVSAIKAPTGWSSDEAGTSEGPYCDDRGIDMTDGGGYPVIQGDKTTFQAAGHCAAYNFGRGDVFICHGYKVPDGEPVLVVRNIEWKDGWPQLK